MFLPSGDQAGKSSRAGSKVKRVLVPRATSRIQMSRLAHRAHRHGHAAAIWRDGRDRVVARVAQSTRGIALLVEPGEHGLRPRASPVDQRAGVGYGEQAVICGGKRIDSVGDGHGLAAQRHFIRIEGLRHQRGPAQENQVPRAAAGRRRIIGLAVGGQQTLHALLVRLDIDGTDIDRPLWLRRRKPADTGNAFHPAEIAARGGRFRLGQEQ